MTTAGAPAWRRYLRFWRADVAADVEDELAFHLKERIDDLVAHGMDPQSARDEALRRLGDLEALKSTCRNIAAHQEKEMRRSEQLAVLRQDVVHALRLMRARLGFTAAVVVTLALGIGATTSIFSVVVAVLLRPLPYADAERIVVVREQFKERGGHASAGHFHDWSEQTTSFDALAAFQTRTVNLTDGEPERILGARVTPSFFRVAYMRPAMGRYFLPDEGEVARVTVLSHGLWQARFGADPAIVGKRITLNGERHTVVGVAPLAYTLTPLDERLWVPMSFTPEQRTDYGAHNLTVLGRLKAGTTLDDALRDLERVTEGIRRRQPDQMVDRGVRVESFAGVIVGDYDTQLWVLLGAVGFVLLIACGNVASLLLARASTRRKEIAIRAALGGSRGRLVRQLLTESLALSVAGGAVGLLVASLGVRFLKSMGPEWLPRLAEAGLQPDVLAFAAAATVLSGILFGLAPALRATRVDLQGELREGGRGSSTVVRDRARAALIVTEMAVALVLLVSAGLFLRSALELQRVPLGFDPSGVTMMRVALPADRYGDAAAVTGAFARILEHVRAVPGVRTAAAGTRVPMWGGSIDIGVRVDGRPQDPKRVDIGHVRLVTPGFVEALRVPLRRGRLLRDSDMAPGAPWVVVVNETFARTLFGRDDPLGQRISGWSSDTNPEWREIVGVIGDTRAFGQANDVPAEIYMPMTQAPHNAWNAFQRAMTVVALARPEMAVAPAMRRAVRSVDPLLPAYDVQTMDDVLTQSTSTRRFNTILLTLLGLTGLVLAAIGVYGVIAFFVTQRTHEIGVRIALGASSASVIRMVVREAVVLGVAGIALGALVAAWATRALGSMLFEVSARDPLAYGAAALVLLLVAVGASWLPARSAARVAPVTALNATG